MRLVYIRAALTKHQIKEGKETQLCRGLPTWCTYFFMCPYEHITTMECKEVCILGQALILSL